MPTWPEETIKPFMLDRPADCLVLLQSLWETTQTWKENKSPIIKNLIHYCSSSIKEILVK